MSSQQPPSSPGPGPNPGPGPQPPQARPVMAQAVPPYRTAPPPRRSSGIRTVFLIMLCFIFVCSVMLNFMLLANIAAEGTNKVQEKYYSHNELGSKKIAIITLEGTILSGDGFIADQIKQAAEDPHIYGVVLRVNSPGGTIYGSDQILHDLRKLKKEQQIPIVVSMGGIAASGGYYVSMAVGDEEDSIFAEPTTWTGSIGVKIPHYDLSKLLQDWGVKEDTIASHELKTMGSFAKPMTEVERKIFQTLVDQSFTQFKDVIKSGRPAFEKNPAALNALATGQVFSAQQAIKNGLVDKIGYLEDAVDRAITLAGLRKNQDQVRVVEYKKVPSLFGILAEGRSSNAIPDMKALLNLNTPQAFYIFSWDE